MLPEAVGDEPIDVGNERIGCIRMSWDNRLDPFRVDEFPDIGVLGKGLDLCGLGAKVIQLDDVNLPPFQLPIQFDDFDAGILILDQEGAKLIQACDLIGES